MEDKTRKFSAVYIRNFIFGVEDSLVSTAGLLSGIAATGMSRPAILLTGIVLIFVEAFSMAAVWAFWFSICLSLLALFMLGLVSAKLSGANMFRNALRMFVVGGTAVGVGVFIGNLVR